MFCNDARTLILITLKSFWIERQFLKGFNWSLYSMKYDTFSTNIRYFSFRTLLTEFLSKKYENCRSTYLNINWFRTISKWDNAYHEHINYKLWLTINEAVRVLRCCLYLVSALYHVQCPYLCHGTKTRETVIQLAFCNVTVQVVGDNEHHGVAWGTLSIRGYLG